MNVRESYFRGLEQGNLASARVHVYAHLFSLIRGVPPILQTPID